MKAGIERRELLLGGAGLVGGSMLSPGTATAAVPASTDRARLEAIADLYVKALLAHDPKVAPFAPGAVFAENDQRLPLGAASWKTFERFGRYRHYFADPDNGEIGLIANAWEYGGGVVFVLRLKVRDGRIVEAEQFVSRDSNGADAYEKLGAPDPVWLEPIPPEQRQSREALRAVSWMYFQALERNDGAGVYPFRDDCERIEHARFTVKQPRTEGYGHSDAATEFMTLAAREQYQYGLMAFVTKIRDRQVLVVDVERGAVLGTSFYDFDGALKKIAFKRGGEWEIPPYFRTSRTHRANEGFKIINGSFRYIEMTFIEVPFSTPPAIPGPAMTVALEYDPPKPLAKPIPTPDRAALDALTARLVDAIVRNAAVDLPIAHGARYTENGIDVKIGTGIWQSIDAAGSYGVTLADPASGQGGWFGTLDERGLHAAVALRYRVKDGLIAEIEAVVVRPQAPAEGAALATATFTMFVPPLEHDLLASAFTQPDAALLKAAPAADGALRQAAAAFDASPRGTIRDNGHAVTPGALPKEMTARDHRIWLADPARGLVLAVALRDYDGTVRKPPKHLAAPWSDLHARLLKVEDGTVAHAESLVARLPYGGGSGWR